MIRKSKTTTLALILLTLIIEMAVGGCSIFKPPDSDGDGVLDPNDECIRVPGTTFNNGCPRSVLFQDNFDRELKSAWDTYSGNWFTKNGALRVKGEGELHLNTRRSPQWRNYYVKTRMEAYRGPAVDPADQIATIILRAKDYRNKIAVVFHWGGIGSSSAGISWYRINDGTRTQGIFNNGENFIDYNLELNTHNYIEIFVSHDQYNVHVGGSELPTATFTEAMFSRGTVGIKAYGIGGRMGVTFDNFVVKTIPGPNEK